jgi:proteasome beta subunit
MDESLKKNILSSGTSLVGIVCKDGIVMAGDRKSTLGGRIVYQKDAKKVIQINSYLVTSGTGSSSDIDMLQRLAAAQLKLKELRDKKRPTVKESANMIAMIAYRNIRQPSMIPFMAGLMVGGINENKEAELYSVGPDGSIAEVKDFNANFSSGMPYILGMLERTYKENMTMEEGVELAKDAIKSASERDTASGYGIDVFTITKEGIKQVSKQGAKAVYKED